MPRLGADVSARGRQHLVERYCLDTKGWVAD
jgi:hypothetical protein